jgi:hypothetical protein
LKRRFGGAWKDGNGSLTLEAALVMPVFLAALLAFVMLIRVVMVETALQTVAAESVKQLAAVWVPLEEPLMKAGQGAGAFAHEVPDFIPEPARPLLSGLGDWGGLAKDALREALSEALTPIVRAQVPDAWRGRLLHPERLRVEDAAVPYVNEPEAAFGFVLVYEMPAALPFVGRTLEIRISARERVWFGM